jgi:hypothetical protein
MGSKYIINGTEEVVDAFTAHSGIVVPVGQTINNAGSYVGTPIVTSITAGSGISVTNPASPGAATVAVSSNVAFLPAQATVTTTSLTLVSTGQGILFTPSQTGNLVILVSAFGNNGTLADGIEVGAGYTAGTALVALGTAMGAAANGYNETIATVAGDNSNLSFTAYISGLTLGTEYAVQPTFASITGGTSTLTITSMVIMEIL